MRTNEERIKAMHKRADELERERRTLRSRMLGAGCVAASLVLILITAAFMPKIYGTLAHAENIRNMNASIFASSSVLGYIIIGLLAFALGIAVTLFCYRLKKWRQYVADDEGEDEDREDTI